MFEDPELPDFDSMSQEELIEWLEQLAKIHGEAASEFFDAYEGEDEAIEADIVPDDDDWSEWRDDSETPLAVASYTVDDGVEQDVPVDLTIFDEEDTAATASMDWLEEITAEATKDELPDFSDSQPSEEQPSSLDHLLPTDETDNPLDWLERLAGNSASHDNASNESEIGDDFDETYEDDEQLDDLEDESLYQSSAERSQQILESLLGLVDREAEKYSTQSMAPVPENETAEPSTTLVVTQPAAQAEPADNLSRAFLLQDREADLEAWYAERLSAIASAGDRATQAPPKLKPAKLPPPGLAAAINSARGKVIAQDLSAAILDYETLLSTTAGLQWVVSDMRDLIGQAEYRKNPSVHRVLGDALMRQGHLNAALGVYRQALSLL